MGQKVNPIGLRLGINRTWDSRWFADGEDYGRLTQLQVPKGHFTTGPEQAEATIDQAPDAANLRRRGPTGITCCVPSDRMHSGHR